MCQLHKHDSNANDDTLFLDLTAHDGSSPSSFTDPNGDNDATATREISVTSVKMKDSRRRCWKELGCCLWAIFLLIDANNSAVTAFSVESSVRRRSSRLYHASDNDHGAGEGPETTRSNGDNESLLWTRRSALVRPTAAVTAALAGVSSLSAQAATASASSTASSVLLSDGTSFPLASFGLQIYNDDTAYQLTLTALQAGYRNFFASVLAGNQRGFARAIKASGIPRNELYICGSVVSNRVQGYDKAYAATRRGCMANMEAFGVGDIDYLDQIMLDYPGPDCESIRGQWAAFETMQREEKLVTSLSVSNFSPAQLDCVLSDKNGAKPVVNQLPYSVAYHPPTARYSIDQNQQRGVLVQAWAPLGGSLGGRFTSQLKDQCAAIGRPYGKSWAQVALRWIVQHGASFTTQTKKKSHFVENLNIFDFELSAEEMAVLDQLA